jgi:hypothetical protein
MNLPSATGNAGLDFALEGGPRTVSPDTPEDLLKEIGKTKCLAPFREAMKRLKLEGRQRVIAAIERTCHENRMLEELGHPNPSMCPEARIPMDLIYELEAQEKDSWNPEMREDTLRHYPGLRLNMQKRPVFGSNGGIK